MASVICTVILVCAVHMKTRWELKSVQFGRMEKQSSTLSPLVVEPTVAAFTGFPAQCINHLTAAPPWSLGILCNVNSQVLCAGEVTGGSSTPEPCEDLLDTCRLYGQSSCGGQFFGWARHNCRKFCGLCGETSCVCFTQTHPLGSKGNEAMDQNQIQHAYIHCSLVY